MKPLLKAIEERRSLRSYTGEGLEDWQVENIIKAFMYAPSAMNWRPCHLIVVRDREKLKELARATPWAKMLEKAGVGLVIACNPEKSRWWIEDGSAASESILLEVADMGLGACWVQVRDVQEMDAEDNVRRILGIPDGFRVLNMIAVGVPKRYKEKHDEGQIEKERLHFDGF